MFPREIISEGLLPEEKLVFWCGGKGIAPKGISLFSGFDIKSGWGQEGEGGANIPKNGGPLHAGQRLDGGGGGLSA